MGLAESDRRARGNSAQPVKGPGARLTNGLQCQRNDGGTSRAGTRISRCRRVAIIAWPPRTPWLARAPSG